MPAPRPQPRIVPLQPRRKPAVRTIRRADAMRRHRFGLPDVREIPRRVAGGPWEAGW